MANFFRKNTDIEKKSAAYYLARIVSDAANPLFIPPVTLLLLGWLMEIDIDELFWMVGLGLVFYTVIPLTTTFQMVRTGSIESIDLPQQNTRNALFIYSIISFCIGSIILGVYFYLNHPFLSIIAVVFLCNPLLGYLFNLKWKISMHSASVASAGVIFFALFYLTSFIETSAAGIFALFILLILLPLMMWSRYYLKVHTLTEVLAGAASGIILTLIEIGLMLRFWQ